MQDWEERMLDEYTELCTRIGKLEDMLSAMKDYKDVLEARNYIEHVW